jgi:ammonium transporter Rh
MVEILTEISIDNNIKDTVSDNVVDDIMLDVPFMVLLALFEFSMLILYYTTTDYGDTHDIVIGDLNAVQTYYGHYTDVAFMIFIGFGFLMTFMRRYSYSAVCYNFLISCVVYQWTILVMGFFHKLHDGELDTKINLEMEMLIEGCFGAGAVMISFGALLGKIPPFQLLLVAILEVFFYGLNFYIGSLILEAVDMGGSMFVHMFGAYFGLSISYCLHNTKNVEYVISEYAGSRTSSDLFAMVGTIFLWILWPSFNGAFATGASQFRVVVNTALSLNASCIMTFLVSRLVNHHNKFDMEHIQNAVLAGGVAIGSSSDLVIGPGSAILIGMISGCVSVFGYQYISPYLEKQFGLSDTCGVHNLHGIPGLIGGIGGIISTRTASKKLYGQDFEDIFNGHDPREQSELQVAAMFVTLGIAIMSGIFVSILIKIICKCIPDKYMHSKTHISECEDSAYFEVATDYKDL